MNGHAASRTRWCGRQASRVARGLAVTLCLAVGCLPMTLCARTSSTAIESWAIVGAKVHSMMPGQAAFDDGVVVVNRGRIRCVGARAKANIPGAKTCPVPADARVFSFTNGVVMPGLIDASTNIGLVEISLEPGSKDGVLGKVSNAAHIRALDGVHMNSRLLNAARWAGVTTVVSRPMGGGLIVGQSVAFRTLGTVVDDALLRASCAIHVNIGNIAKVKGQPLVSSRSGQIATLRDLLTRAGHLLDNPRKARNNVDPELARMRHDPAMRSLAQVRRKALALAVHAHRADDIAAALRLKRDLGVNIIIVGGIEAHVEARHLARQDVPVVLAPVRTTPSNFETLRAVDNTAARLHRSGVTIALGTASNHRARNLRWSAGYAVTQGLPHLVALRAITRTPAKLFGLTGLAGQITEGSRANLVVFDGDPLTLESRVRIVALGTSVELEPKQR